MTQLHLLNMHHEKFLQFVASGAQTSVLVEPTHTLVADSITFQILPYGPQQDIVQVYCSSGSHVGKYLLVNSNNEVVAGATTDGDSVFLRQNAGSLGSPLLTITLTPVNVPTHYVSFHAESGMAQLETELTDRSRLQLVDTELRQPVAKDDLGAVQNLLTGVESQEMTEDN